VWDTLKLLPAERLPVEWRQAAAATPACPSFMHLHVGFDGAGGCCTVLGPAVQHGAVCVTFR
jgi:hypothetical protein